MNLCTNLVRNNKSMSFIIAIDGPAGSGKGTITKRVANKIGFLRLDTGALYRCVTLEVLRNNIDIKDVQKMVDIVRNMKVEFVTNEDINELDYVFLNNEDVTKAIRSNEVNNIISVISSIKEVREEMLEIQRNIAREKDTIMEGRDIGTVVFPNADLKIYLNADIEERARRRYKENLEKGIETTYEEVLEILKNRDKIDMEREVAPLKKADDAIEIDSTNMSIEEVVDKIVEIYYNKCDNRI